MLSPIRATPAILRAQPVTTQPLIVQLAQPPTSYFRATTPASRVARQAITTILESVLPVTEAAPLAQTTLHPARAA